MNRELIARLCGFLDASPTAFHAVDSISALLEGGGGRRLDETGRWSIEPGGLYYVVRGASSLIAFRAGNRKPEETGFSLAGAHTDSPALKARIEKPLSGKGMERVPVEVYGGPILSSWLDRPLSLAGRVVLRTGTRLFRFPGPVGIIPDLAIHLNRDINKGFEYNAQTHLPVLVSAFPAPPGKDRADGKAETRGPWILERVARELGVEPREILAADLFFVDSQPACLLGGEGEIVNSCRLDDLAACHAVLEALLEAGARAHGQIACFLDNEEVGSRTAQGADSSFLRDTIERVCAVTAASAPAPATGVENFHRALARSFMVSVDVAQAYHPSYPEKYDEAFAPVLNGGPVIKANANFRYATDAESAARFRLLCEAVSSPCQTYLSRADIAPGSTIGPLSASITGIQTVDVGHPLLSMHAIRESIGALDHGSMVEVLRAHFEGRSG